MKIFSTTSIRQSNVGKKLFPKRCIEIPLELKDNIYNTLSEHQRAFDYLANRYKMSYEFSPSVDDKAYVFCAKKYNKSGAVAWSKAEISANDSFEDSARKIYQLADEVISMAEG